MRAYLAALLLALASAACGGGAAEAPDLPALPPSQWPQTPLPGAAAAEQLPRRVDPRTGLHFLRVPAGSLRTPTLGGRELRITREFWLAETELTIGQWRRYVRELGGDASVPVPAGDDALPMPLSFLDAERFCRRLGYRLPSEFEWELACRAGSEPANAPWASPAGMREHAWFNANAGDGSRPVATRAANAWGFHDMLGNLWEWCADWHGLPPEGDPVIDPRGPATGTARVLRGGSWFTTPAALPETRSQGFPGERNAFYGLRPAADG
jgi:formylglycine-generating enzyme required for sulfatase activity